jgi:hypothetical protein
MNLDCLYHVLTFYINCNKFDVIPQEVLKIPFSYFVVDSNQYKLFPEGFECVVNDGDNMYYSHYN